MFSPLTLFRAPEVNPINKKARSIPSSQPLQMFMVASSSSLGGDSWLRSCPGNSYQQLPYICTDLIWYHRYAWSPLITKTIKADLHLTQNQIANSNILALTATLIVRLISGPLCDKFGPRYVFAGCLVAGAIPTAFAFTIKGATSLIVVRFFVGILGGSFVPCQVWSTGILRQEHCWNCERLHRWFRQ